MGLLEAVTAAEVEQQQVQEQGSLPCPGFEGFEKRLEVLFESEGSLAAEARGLRDIPRAELDEMLSAAQCTIVSKMANKWFDSYVLSESSLFVYPYAVVIKTCGTTRLLRAIPQLLASAVALNLKPSACRYTRGSFIFPEAQQAPHHDFAAEAAELEGHFGHLGHGGRAYVLGDALSGSNWHVYTADATPFAASPMLRAKEAPVLTLEVCMTKLDKGAAKLFFSESGLDAKGVTRASGIRALLPGSSIDDFSFSPCGYSMNGIEGGMHSTIHVTPEDGFSYASFETRSYAHSTADLRVLLSKVLEVFKPGCASVAIRTEGPVLEGLVAGDSWWGSMAVPKGYWCAGSSQQQLPGGGSTVFHTLKAEGAGPVGHAVCPLPLSGVAAAAGVGAAQPVGAAGSLFSALPSLEVDEEMLLFAAAGQKKAAMAAGANGAAAAGTWEDEGDVMETDGEVTDCVVGALSKRGEAVARAVTGLRPVLLARGDVEMDGLCAELIVAKEAAAADSEGGLLGEAAAMAAERAFYVMDVGEVLKLWDLWTAAMPRVEPFYAVKCNPDKALLGLLASLGAGFDVASLPELEAVAEVFGGEVPSQRIIFANPCKLPSHIGAAASRGVHLSTFDSESELAKLAKSDPCARAVLRIRVDDPSARCPLGVKYGAELGECRRLLHAAKRLGVSVAGVAFHVGSGAGDASAFALGVAAARRIFDTAACIGFTGMNVLDIGGGFTSDGGVAGGASFKEAAATIAAALEEHFPRAAFPALRVIAEPGRFFAESPYTLVAHVFGTRARGRGSRRHYEYWINDGIYGSMNSLLYDHAVLSVRPLRVASAASAAAAAASAVAAPSLGTTLSPAWVPGQGYAGRGKQNKLFSSTVFGPTCDGLDTVLRDVRLPKLQSGDWLVFPRMGAYTKAAGSSFNGFAVDDIKVAAHVLTSAMARPFYSSKCSSSGFSLGLVETDFGEIEWGLLEGSDASSDEEDERTWMGEGSSSGSDSDE